MRCYICDAALTDEEVRFNRLHGDYDPCGTCREVIQDVFKAEREEGTLLDEGYDDGDTTLSEPIEGVDGNDYDDAGYLRDERL